MLLTHEVVPKLITVKPTIENCDPVALYRNSAPIDDFNLQEITPILYGGGRKLYMNSVFDPVFGYYCNPLKYIVLSHQKAVEVDLFALNSCFIIWLNDYSKGIELQYSHIQSLSIKKNQEGNLMLSLKVVNKGIFYNNNSYSSRPEFIEFTFTPIHSEYERYYNDEIENLFTYENFGVNKGDKLVTNTFNAITKCSVFHLEDEHDDLYIEQQQVLSGTNLDCYSNGYVNDGNADDMDYNNMEMEYNEYGAGIDVNVINEEELKRGVVRTRDDYINTSPSKRVRC